MPKNTRARGGHDFATNPPPADVADTPQEGETGGDTPQAPNVSAPKSEWHTFAADNGADPETLQGTKAEIIDWARAAGHVAD